MIEPPNTAPNSGSSSPLSCCADAPTPPPPDHWPLSCYPTPPHSQQHSDTGTPCPDGNMSAVSSDREGHPPAKRRRTEPKPRTTEHLDLRNPTVSDAQNSILDTLVKTLHKRRKIVVVAGAGISVSAGIPDFRSSTGLFTSLRAEHNIKGSGKHLFDASVYKDDSSTSHFHDMVRNMSKMTRNARPTDFHHMLATLAHDNRLLRLYTQNVDCIDTSLEPLATQIPLAKAKGGSWPKTVQLHGGLDKMVCSKCATLSQFDADLFDGPTAPICEVCVELDRVRTDIAGKRSHGVGRLRPRMVLYNEANPDDEAIGAVTQDDLRKRPDAIIVVGTSLKIPGVRRIVREMCATVRGRRDGVAIWINNDPEPLGKEFEDCWDIVVRGTCDEVARHVALRKWYESAEMTELTEAEWNEMAASDNAEVVINTAFKPISSMAPFRAAPHSPDFTPLTPSKESRFTSYNAANIGLPGPLILKETLDTSMKNTKGTAFDALQGAGAKVARKPRKKAKTTTVKGKKGATLPQPRINQTLKTTKASAATSLVKKNDKISPKKRASPQKRAGINTVMQPVPVEDPRINHLHPHLTVDPGTSDSCEASSLSSA